MKTQEQIDHVVGGLYWLLGSFNVAAFLLSLGLTTRKTNFSWETNNPVSYFVNSREFPTMPWLNLAALALSVGVYFFAMAILETFAMAISETQKPESEH